MEIVPPPSQNPEYGSQVAHNYAPSAPGYPVYSQPPQPATVWPGQNYTGVAQYVPPVMYVPHPNTAVGRVVPSGPKSSEVRWRSFPQSCVCVYCNNSITTSTEPVIGCINHLAAFCCCVLGCWYGCCLIPYNMDTLSNIAHHCPACQNRLGTYTRV